MSIITSLLDTDLYKLSMAQLVFHQFSSAVVEYRFKLRNKGIDLTPYKEEIEKEIDELCKLKFKENELEYLKNLPFITQDYIELLRIMKLSRKFVIVDNTNGELSIKIKGPWFLVIYFEVAVLAIVNEVYFNAIKHKHNKEYIPPSAYNNLKNKIDLIKSTDIKFADFGTRRRFSKAWHEEIIKILKEEIPNNFVGTSNVLFAMKYGVKPIGTFAHEMVQAGQAFTTLRNSQKFMLQKWADEYRGQLGIALSDTLGIDAFLKDFDLYFAKLYDGIRQDSGSPWEVADKVIDHYLKLGIDPKTKTIVFSDGLDFDLALALHNKFKDEINTLFGIGTNLTNDCGYDPLQIVIKLTEVNGSPVAKLSDSSGKEMCKSVDYMNHLREVFK